MLIEIDGKKILLKPLSGGRPTGCEKVCMVENSVFALATKNTPTSIPGVYIEEYYSKRRRWNYYPFRAEGRDALNLVVALGKFGLVDVKRVIAEQERAKWQRDFDSKREQLEESANDLSIPFGPTTKMGKIIHAKAKKYADGGGWEGERKSRAMKVAKKSL